MRRRIANLTSNILSPFSIGLALILVVSFEVAVSVSDAIKWSALLTGLSVLPVLLFTIYMVRRKRLDSVLSGARRQRIKVYALSVVLAGINCIVLIVLRAPLLLRALFITGFVASVIFMGINLWWKISLHTAFITAAVSVLSIVYGFMALPAIVLIPLVGWARLELEHHTLAQVVTGALGAALISGVTFYLYGLI